MLRNWSGERRTFDVANKIESSSDGVAEARSLPGSYPGSSAGLEFDVEAGPVSDRESEAGSYHGPSIDWLAQALDVRERLLLKVNKEAEELESEETESEESVSEESESVESESEVNEDEQQKPPTPLPDYDNLEPDNELPTGAAAPIRGILKKNADTYELEKYRKNAMIIFNHKDFLAGVKKSREGTMRDEERLKATFEKFGFEVETHLNLYKATLLQELKKFCSKDFAGYGCVCAAILTHGSRHGYLRAFDTRYSEHELIECFNKRRNPSLLGKPIIILIQACRGDEPATAVNPGTPKLDDDVEMDTDDYYYNLPTESDMLIFHSSYVKRASARDQRKGSWFIQTLCKQILLLAATKDFEAICKAVKKEVALEKEHTMTLNSQSVVVKQMPVVTSTLLRNLYLRKYEGFDDDEADPIVLRDETMMYTEVTLEQVPAACGCDAYVEYMKRCIRLFIRENPSDEIAFSILELSDEVKSGDRNIHVKAGMANLIRNYLNRNADRFQHSEAMFLGQPCCCIDSSRTREACRGDEPATAVNPGTPKLDDDVEMDTDDYYYNLPTESDMLIFHSSYVKRASARLFIRENPSDEIAFSILELSDEVKSGDRNIHVKAGMANLIRNYLNRNADSKDGNLNMRMTHELKEHADSVGTITSLELAWKKKDHPRLESCDYEERTGLAPQMKYQQLTPVQNDH